jgi:hypothetical protein
LVVVVTHDATEVVLRRVAWHHVHGCKMTPNDSSAHVLQRVLHRSA